MLNNTKMYLNCYSKYATNKLISKTKKGRNQKLETTYIIQLLLQVQKNIHKLFDMEG